LGRRGHQTELLELQPSTFLGALQERRLGVLTPSVERQGEKLDGHTGAHRQSLPQDHLIVATRGDGAPLVGGDLQPKDLAGVPLEPVDLFSGLDVEYVAIVASGGENPPPSFDEGQPGDIMRGTFDGRLGLASWEFPGMGVFRYGGALCWR
jgi:hypothetical protein